MISDEELANSKEYAEVWARAHAAGKEEGRAEGYDVGRQEGLEEGRDQGLEEGREIGYYNGYEYGYEVGCEDTRDNLHHEYDEELAQELSKHHVCTNCGEATEPLFEVNKEAFNG